MEKKINLVALLKDCPSGMELNCTMYDNLYFDKVDEEYRYPIGCYTIYDGCRTSVNFTEFGEFNNYGTAKCVIFPKDRTTWEGFVPPCKFKVGDKIKNKNSGICDKVIEIFKDCYLVESCLNEQCTIGFDIQDNWELVPHKFDINTLKPFESKVLVRGDEHSYWKPAIFGCYIKDMSNPCYTVGGTCWAQCIPYEENKHLLGKTNKCDEFYIFWEE